MPKTEATAASVSKALAAFASATRSIDLQRFFQTQPGGYGEGDRFLGLRVPEIRSVAKQFRDLQVSELQKLAKSKWHEERFCAIAILTDQAERSRDAALKRQHFEIWLDWVRQGRINNWDLIDVFAPRIGAVLVDRKTTMPLLRKLSKSNSLWERRSAILLTFAHLRAGSIEETLELAELLVDDEHDLINKAVGWALREVGNRQPLALRQFLAAHASTMPRVALRYAIEKLAETERRRWLLEAKTS